MGFQPMVRETFWDGPRVLLKYFKYLIFLFRHNTNTDSDRQKTVRYNNSKIFGDDRLNGVDFYAYTCFYSLDIRYKIDMVHDVSKFESSKSLGTTVLEHHIIIWFVFSSEINYTLDFPIFSWEQKRIILHSLIFECIIILSTLFYK